MACEIKFKALSFSLLILTTLLLISSLGFSFASLEATKSADPTPAPAPWPHQFHSILFMNNTAGQLQAVDLWYDWIKGRNFNIIQNQQVGILRPNWLDGATYLGQRKIDGFLCNVWEKVDFIWYYEDVITKKPVYWKFYTGMVAHVMTFEVGAVLEDEKWQAPIYCFKNTEVEKQNSVLDSVVSGKSSHGSMMRGGVW